MPLFGANFEGTWKLNQAKCVSPAPLPASEVIAFRLQNARYEVTVMRSMTGEPPASFRYSFLRYGGPGKVIAGPFDELITENIDPVTTQIILRNKSRDIDIEQLTTTEDEKQLTLTGSTLSPPGRMMKHIYVYDRQ